MSELNKQARNFGKMKTYPFMGEVWQVNLLIYSRVKMPSSIENYGKGGKIYLHVLILISLF